MRPNILIFMTDQEQADVVHPDHPCITPNATRLAQEGVLFSRSFCPTAHCCPSRATFMTGVYPSRHGIYNNVSNPTAIHHELYEGVGMFSEVLRSSVITWRMPENGMSPMPRTHPTEAGRICTLRGQRQLHAPFGSAVAGASQATRIDGAATRTNSSSRLGALSTVSILPDRHTERLRRPSRLSRCPIWDGGVTAIIPSGCAVVSIHRAERTPRPVRRTRAICRDV